MAASPPLPLSGNCNFKGNPLPTSSPPLQRRRPSSSSINSSLSTSPLSLTIAISKETLSLTLTIANFKVVMQRRKNSVSRGSLQKILQEGQQRLLDEQASMNQREEYIFYRYQELDRLGKELEASKANLEKESAALIEKKSNIELKMVSLAAREENDIKKILADEEARLKQKHSEFEEELQKKAKMV